MWQGPQGTPHGDDRPPAEEGLEVWTGVDFSVCVVALPGEAVRLWGQDVMLLNLLRSAGIISKWIGSKYPGSARLLDRERSPSLVAWNKLS